MKRIQQKVKDLIEVRKYKSLHDFFVEPEKTLSTYHYTAITSELMANWIAALVDVQQGGGAAKALAGYRGVGKSHFLATFSAIISNPELRSQVTDSHVAAGTHHLRRRHYPVALVQRGTKETLTEELLSAVADAFQTEVSELPSNLEALLEFASTKAGDLPFVIIVDTASERANRVSREDGVLLGELAEIAKRYNIFICVALDDDITDADGINGSIAQSYTIDYLDQEHLHQIVNAHIYPKHRQTQSLIRQLYQDFREVIPSFRWSEPRFTSLYPLHPSILEVAPFVRFYASDFAMLGFASEAGSRILGRPANSLICLDEVFDNIESTLRKSDELNDAFEVYDKINKDVVSAIPVMQRLQAKLILKALFILSLDGDGTSASEISAAMMIYDEDQSGKSLKLIQDLLEQFVSVCPDGLWKKEEEGREARFSIKVSSKDNLNSALEESAAAISDEMVPLILRRIGKNKFEDLKTSVDKDFEKQASITSEIQWRGGYRQGGIFWNWDNEAAQSLADSENSETLDLEVIINRAGGELGSLPESGGNPRIVWQTAELNTQEVDAIKRLYVLFNNGNLREEFGDQVRAAGHTHIVAVEKIWERIFISDAKFLVDEREYHFESSIKGIRLFSKVLSLITEPILNDLYPEHPTFAKPLGIKEVSILISDLFSGARANIAGVQDLAAIYALPLGLVGRQGNNFVLESDDALSKLPLVEKLLTLVSCSEEDTVSLKSIYERLQEKPFGLVKEAQHLILAALVANRKIEFVTSKGDRINNRSLDLNIIWEDIVGVAVPEDVVYEQEELLSWVSALTAADGIESPTDIESQKLIQESISGWVENWNSSAVLSRFNDLPDEILNTKIWKVSTSVEKTFGVVAKTLQSVVDESIPLDQGLQRIADTFFNSKAELKNRKKDLALLDDFIEGSASRDKIWSYLAISESTDVPAIERLRENLLELIENTYESPSAETNLEMETVWESFHAAYSEHFALKHDAIMKSRQLRDELGEIQKSDEWWEFENLSKMPIFQKVHWQKTQKILKQFRRLDCSFDVNESLKSKPFCACFFSLARVNDMVKLPKALSETIHFGLKSYHRTISMMRDYLVKAVDEHVKNEKDKEFVKDAKALIQTINEKSENYKFSNGQFMVLHSVLNSISSSSSIAIEFPDESGLHTSKELRDKINAWFDELPTEEILLKV
ncbi:MAG: hypothetical protein HKN25_13205 [Pyrinomonadaceae bacterium]|nr:hypothetical protein [Pyrinomonadaceae bacterium]